MSAARAALLIGATLALPAAACDFFATPDAERLVGAPLVEPATAAAPPGQRECAFYPPGFEPVGGAPERGLRFVVQRFENEVEARSGYFAVIEERRRVFERQGRSAGHGVAEVHLLSDVGDAATAETRAVAGDPSRRYTTLTLFRGFWLAQVTAWRDGDPQDAAASAARRLLAALR